MTFQRLKSLSLSLSPNDFIPLTILSEICQRYSYGSIVRNVFPVIAWETYERTDLFLSPRKTGTSRILATVSGCVLNSLSPTIWPTKSSLPKPIMHFEGRTVKFVICPVKFVNGWNKFDFPLMKTERSDNLVMGPKIRKYVRCTTRILHQNVTF